MEYSKLRVILLSLFLFCALLPFSAYGQESTAIGLQLGLNAGFQSWTPDPPSEISNSSLMGIAIDAHTDWYLSEDLVLSDQLMYYYTGVTSQVTSSTLPSITKTTRYGYQYIELELAPKYKFGVEPFQEYIMFGPHLGYLLDAVRDEESETGKVKTNITSESNRINFGLDIGGGLMLRLNDKWYLQSELVYAHGLTDIRKGSETSAYSRDLRLFVGALLAL